MMNDLADTTLLRRWRDHRDALAFRELTRRYGGLVSAAANRVLANATDEEDIAQECFLKLAAAPPEPRRSLGAWLHTVAVRCAINHVRGETRRRGREAAYEPAQQPEIADMGDLLQHVDEAIAALPQRYRDCIVGHFLRGIETAQLADELGVSRWTVQRRMNAGIVQVRARLARRGITVTAGVLTMALGGLKCGAAPLPLAAVLGKIAVAGGGGSDMATAGLAAGNGLKLAGGIFVMKESTVLGCGMIALMLAAWWQFGGPPPEAVDTANTEIPSVAGPAIQDDVFAAPALAMADDSGEASAMEDPREDPPPADLDHWPLLAPPNSYAPTPIADPTKAAAVAGIVVDSMGRPIPGAHVTVLLAGSTPSAPAIVDAGPLAYAAHLARQSEVASDPAFKRVATTDNMGGFVIDDIRFTGDFTAYASADGYTRGSTGGVLELESVSDVSVALNEGRAMYGKVVTSSGLPVPDASVASTGLFAENQILGGASPPFEALRDRTDREGNFTLWLKVTDPDREWSTGLHIKSARHGAGFFSPVRIDPEQRTTITLESQLARLSGTISSGERAPARNHRILISGRRAVSSGTSKFTGPGCFFETMTDESGAYSFEGLPSDESLTVHIRTPGGKTAATQPLPTLVAGKENVWDWTLDEPIRVTGEVHGMKNNLPLPGILVRYVFRDEERHVSDLTYTDDDGAFSFEIASGAGDYTFRTRYQRDGSNGSGGEHESAIALVPGEDAFVVLKIPAPWTRSFQLVDQFGQPVPGVRGNVTLEISGGSSSTTSRQELSNADGLVTYDLLDPGASAAFNFHREGYISEMTEPAEGQPGDARPTETIVLYRSADIVARLLDATGEPISNTVVTCDAAYDEDRSTSADAATDADGWLVLQGQLPGTITDLALEVKVPNAEGELQARVEGVDLVPAMENNLGDITMTGGS